MRNQMYTENISINISNMQDMLNMISDFEIGIWTYL